MKYVVRGHIENGEIKYGVYDNQYLDTIHNTSYQNLILLLDNMNDALDVCKILNKEDVSMKGTNNQGFKMGDIVTFNNEYYDIGVIENTMGLYYMVNMVDKKGNLTGHKYLMHRNELRYKFQ